MEFNTGLEGFLVRQATCKDTPLIFSFIQALAEYEKRPQDVTATQQQLHHWLFEQNAAHVLLAEYKGEPAGYALFYTTFSSFAGIGGVYLEDLFIHPHLRGKGLGKCLMRQVAAFARAKGCQSMQWTCLDWNTPSIEFYKSLGAKTKGGNTFFVLQDQKLEEFAQP